MTKRIGQLARKKAGSQPSRNTTLTSLLTENRKYTINLVQATYVASDWGFDAGAHHHTPPKKKPQHSHYYSATRPWPMPPPVKPWGQRDKDLLQRRRTGRSGVVVAAPEAPGTSVSVNVLPSPSPD